MKSFVFRFSTALIVAMQASFYAWSSNLIRLCGELSNQLSATTALPENLGFFLLRVLMKVIGIWGRLLHR